ncbi:3-isopropylmalate dehydratase small subunit [hydrothermal vent metagenome]|uniref:3-isopropylmalate dehydratase small subunit n=1 Tax=hydrothermal vent metagenome TaxID=652676 RepID=A0A3B1E646_9ZZZZ
MNLKNITGKVWTFGDNIDTDVIIAARYLNSSDPKHLAKYVMEDSDIHDFASQVNAGDIIVAGENFGCGSSREHAPIALKTAGVSAIIAPTFARIFYRNAFNMGLPIFELPQASQIKANNNITIDLDAGTITNNTSNKIYKFNPIPPFMKELIATGGLMEFAKKEVLGKDK